MSEPQAAAADCDHFFETRILGGQPLSVRICQFCRTPDWADLREQLDVLYGGNEAAMTRVFGGDRAASVIAHTLNAHGHSIQRVRYMTDAELLAVPGIGEASLATIRAAFPRWEHDPEPDESDELVCVDECGSCDACGMEPFGTPAEGWREASRFLRRVARSSGNRMGALHGAQLIEAELRRRAAETRGTKEIA